MTHIDADHIDGSILLIRDRHHLGVTFGEVWFNDWGHIERSCAAPSRASCSAGSSANPDTSAYPPVRRGRRSGGDRAAQPTVGRRLHVNRAFGGDQPVVAALDDRVVLPGGAELIVVSPRTVELRKLRPNWRRHAGASRTSRPARRTAVTSRMDAKYRPPPD